MITEDDLRTLLAEAAESAPPPGAPPEALLDALDGEAAAPPARAGRRDPGRRVLAIAAAVLVAAVVVGGLAGLEDDGGVDDAQTAADESADGFPSTTVASGGAASGGGVALGYGDRDAATESADLPDLAGVPTAGSEGGGAGAAAPPAPSAPDQGASVAQLTDGAKVVKTGSIDLEVPKGSFDEAAAQVTAKATGLGGYVAESVTSQADDIPSGAITVRVPAAGYDAMLTELRRLGDVRSETSKGTDVTAQYTDLEARLNALRATRDRLETVLAEADTVGDILMVQDRITAVQSEIESYQGRMQLLDDQASMATLAVTLAEPGGDPVTLTTKDDERDLGGAWDDARRRFGNGIEGLVAWSGVALLLVLAALALTLLGRRVWPRVRRYLI